MAITALSVSAVAAPTNPVFGMAADPPLIAGLAASRAEATVEAIPATPDPRVAQVKELLDGRPLAEYAGLMIETADRYGVDWRLMPSIGFQESGGGRVTCGGNAWGWANCDVSFESFEAGIEIVAGTLSEYPYAGEDIATIACIWQSGGGCDTYSAIEYAYKIAYFYEKLGGSFALPARIPAPDAGLVEPAAAGTTPTATPEATATVPSPPTPPPPPEPTPAGE
ncbi:MAG: hypothetical protein WEC33_03740 [Dehalococcoidia bacterium]